MVLIHDYKNDVVGYLYDHLIVSITDNKLMGIILGNSVYTANAKMVGRYFKEKIIDTKGETIAVVKAVLSHTDTLLQGRYRFIDESWEIIKKINAYVYGPIEEKMVWSKNNFADIIASS